MLVISKPNEAKAFAIGANCLLHLFDDIVNYYMFSMKTFVDYAEGGVILYPPWINAGDPIGRWVKDNNMAIAVHYPKRYIIPSSIDTLIISSFDDACVPKCRFTKTGNDKNVFSFYHYNLYSKMKELGYVEDAPFMSAEEFKTMFKEFNAKCDTMWKPKNKVLLTYDIHRAPAEMRDRILQYDAMIRETIPNIKSIQVSEGNIKHFDGVWCHYVDAVKYDIYNQIFGVKSLMDMRKE